MYFVEPRQFCDLVKQIGLFGGENSYKMLPASDAEDCAQLCQGERMCEAASFVMITSNTCHLYAEMSAVEMPYLDSVHFTKLCETGKEIMD